MTYPFTEDPQDVDFYAMLYNCETENEEEDVNLCPTPVGDYWIQAAAREDAASVAAESPSRRLKSMTPSQHDDLPEETSDDRALLSKRRLSPAISVSGGWSVEFDEVSLYMIPGSCLRFGGSVSSTGSPWTIFGDIALGNGCMAPTNRFSFQGTVGVSYGWEVKVEKTIKVLWWKTKFEAGCNLGIYGYIGGRVGTHAYNCGRRLEQSAGRRLGGQAAEIPSNVSSVLVSATQSNDPSMVVEEDLVEVDDFKEDDSGVDARRLGWRRRRRRRQCHATGFELIAGVGVGGGCSISRRRLGVSLKGSLDMSLGPWPQSPLDARAKGSISASACIKIGPFNGCIGISGITLFDANI
jgi:hypothetical protein